MIDPGEGYRLLKDKEIIQGGDEYYSRSCGKWIETGDAGDTVNYSKLRTIEAYRRRVEGKTVWRLLEVGETIREGDEFYSFVLGWAEVAKSEGLVVNIAMNPIRRKLPLSTDNKQIADLNKQLQEPNDGLVETEKEPCEPSQREQEACGGKSIPFKPQAREPGLAKSL